MEGAHSDVRDLVCGRDGQGRKRRGQGDKSDGEIISNGIIHRTGRKTADVDKLASKTRTRFHEQMRFLVQLLKVGREHATCVESTFFTAL